MHFPSMFEVWKGTSIVKDGDRGTSLSSVPGSGLGIFTELTFSLRSESAEALISV